MRKSREIHRLKNSEIVNALKKGDEVVFEYLFKEYYARLTNYSVTIVKSRDLAYDIVQSIFVTLWENRKRLNPDLSLRNYLLTSTHNNSLKSIRDRKIMSKHHDKIRESTIVNREQEHSMEEKNNNLSEKEKVEKILHSLAPRGREVMKMRYYQSMKSSEIADELGISVRTVETIIYQSKKKLRK